MNPAKIDPDLHMLSVMTEDELRTLESEKRMDLSVDADSRVHVTVSIRCEGVLAEIDGVTPVSVLGELITAQTTTDMLGELSEQDNVLFISAVRGGTTLMHRTRAQVGATITDGQRIRNGGAAWNGTGTVVGIIDSGIDLHHPAFREFPGGPSRVEFYWDRRVDAADRRPIDVAGPGGIGVVYTKAQIDAHLLGPAAAPPILHTHTLDFDGHGTHVAGIAAGSSSTNRGIAAGAQIIFVRYRDQDMGQLHALCDWVFTQAGAAPCAINISLGMSNGPHDGTSDVETGLDGLLRDPASQEAREGRFIAVAAGNERQLRYNVTTRVLAVGRPLTRVTWESPNGNDATDELEFWYSGLDRIAIRIISTVGGANRITHWVDPDPAGCRERVSPGGFAPTVAGPAVSKRFDFSGGSSAIISQSENPLNGDRQIVVRLQPPAAGGIITGGLWQLEFEALNELPGGGRIDGFVRSIMADSAINTSFRPAQENARDITVANGDEVAQNLRVGMGIAPPAEVTVVIEYPSWQRLEVQVQPPVGTASDPSQWVGHGPVAVAGGATIAPGAAVADGLPFVFPNTAGPDQPVLVNHVTVGHFNRITITLRARPNPPDPDQVPEVGIYRLVLRNLVSNGPVVANAHLIHDRGFGAVNCLFQDADAGESNPMVYPDSCLPAVTRLRVEEEGPFESALHTRIPAGGADQVRVRIPPADSLLETGGWTFTPWIAPGNAEVVTAGALAVTGAPAAGAARTYASGRITVSVNYPAPAAGADSVIDVTLADTTFTALNVGDWKIEYQQTGAAAAPREIRSTIRRRQEGAETQEQFVSSVLDSSVFFASPLLQPLTIPFRLPRKTADEIQLELLYDVASEIRLRVIPPAPHTLPFSIGLNNEVTTDTGAVAPATGPNGATGALSNGTAVTLNIPDAEVFPSHRRALVSIRHPAAMVFHPEGIWRLEVRPVQLGGAKEVTVRLFSQGHAAELVSHATENRAAESGSLSAPSTAREVMAVANGLPTISPLSLPNDSSSAGPIRPASWMRINGNNRPWLHYPKPELLAPGTEILAPCSGEAAMWFNHDTPLGWRTYEIADGRHLRMNATWPLLSNGQRRHSQPVNPAPAAGTLTQTDWTFIIPAGSNDPFQLVVRYPAARAFAIRLEQPAASPGDRRTHAVRPNGSEWAVGGANVAAGAEAPAHPDGPGRFYVMGDEARIYIRQNGNGQATVTVRSGFAHAAGQWQLTVQHTEVFAPPVDVTLTAIPPADERGWPKFRGNTETRVSLDLGVAAAAAVPGEINFPVTVPARMAGDFAVQISYPAPPAGPGAYSFEVLVVHNGQHTRAVDTNSNVLPLVGALAINAAVPNGARFQFATGEHITIVHTPGSAAVTFSRGVSADFCIDEGEWFIRLLNRSQVIPAPAISVTAELDPGPHDAVFFPLPTGLLPTGFSRSGHLVAAAIQEWNFHMPQNRQHELVLELIYDTRDTVEVQVNIPGGGRTAPVRVGNIAVAGVAGATLADVATAVAPAAREFHDANRFRILVDHQVHPASNLRSRVLITIRSDGAQAIPAGTWQLRINPTAIDAASHGVVEAFVVEMQYFVLSGTSMATPHVTGLAALMLQQDTAQSHEDIKRRLLQTAKPVVISQKTGTQLPNQWDPVAGWGMVDGAAALLSHDGGFRHNHEGAPEALGKTTGCPLACEDNCLIEGISNNGALSSLHITHRAPYNHAPSTPGGDALVDCPRLARYLERYHSTPFTGWETVSFQTLPSTALRQPLMRERSHRGGLNGFEAISWDRVYEILATQLVEQWASTGTILVMEGRPEAGLIKEILFNRFVHHLHHLLGANNQVTKCSFTTKRKVSVLASRVPYGSPFAGAGFQALTELLNDHAPRLVSRSDLSLADSVIVWGANLPANAQALWRNIASARAVRGDAFLVFVIDPGLQELPDFARRISLAPGSDRHLALALMLRMQGDGAAIPADPRFSDANLGFRTHLGNQASHDDAFLGHVRTEAAGYLTVAAAGAPVTPAAALTNILLPNATADERERFRNDFDALYESYMSGCAATILGGGAGRYVDGEEHLQYIAAVSLLSGNIGMPGGGISFGEDLHLQFNNETFAESHDSRRPELNSDELGSTEQQETLNMASLAADAPNNTKVMIWFDLDLLTHLPDADNTEVLLGTGGTQLNIQITTALDDSSRFADIILPVTDTLQSWDIQLAKRSPWLNLTQPLKPLPENEVRPLPRVLHEMFKAIRNELVDEYHDDLQPTIDENIYQTGPMLLSHTRRSEFSEFFTNATRIPDLLVDALPRVEAANIHRQLQEWYSGVHGNEPTTDTESEMSANNWVNFFNRMQVDWILEVLMARYNEREVVMLLYQLLQRGTALDPKRYVGEMFGLLPDGMTPWGSFVVRGDEYSNLKGSAGFAPERENYRTPALAVDANADHGRAEFPMRVIVGQANNYPSTRIPLDCQITGGAVQKPEAFVNPASPSLQGRGFNAGDEVVLVGNLSYDDEQTFFRTLSPVLLRFDTSMARETVWMRPGWNGFNRGSQRLMRGLHTEEGETPALFDNLVRIEANGFTPGAGAADRGTNPPKR